MGVSERDQFFIDKGVIERERIRTLFKNFNFEHSRLITTDPASNDQIDFMFISGGTKMVFGEMKIRNILSNKYSDGLIEAIKFKCLYDYHKADCKVFYVVEYLDFYMVWTLEAPFLHYSCYRSDNYFSVMNASADMY